MNTSPGGAAEINREKRGTREIYRPKRHKENKNL
jgi:hypothetical protein